MADAGMIHDELVARREVAADMAEAARAWLDTFDAEQRTIGQGAVPADDRSDNERRRWFYTPTDHGGLTIHQQRPAQHRAAMRLVSTGLSPAAYVTVATIIGLENVLDYTEGFQASFDRERSPCRHDAVLPGHQSCRVSSARRSNDRPLAGVEDLGRDLLRSLRPELAA